MFEQAWQECIGCCKMTMFRDKQGRAECIECAAAQIPTIILLKKDNCVECAKEGIRNTKSIGETCWSHHR